MGFLTFLLVVSAAAFGYLVYKKGFDGATATVGAALGGLAAWASGLFDNVNSLF